MNKCNIFHPGWIKLYGNPWDRDGNGVADWKEARRRFDNDDFKCDANDNNRLKSYRGRIKSIRGNLIRVYNSRNEECDVYLGACSNVETAGRYMPQVGDQIYWRGYHRARKQQYPQFNAHHVTCFDK